MLFRSVLDLVVRKILDDRIDMQARLDEPRRHVEHFDVSLVVNYKPPVWVEHAKAMRHVVQRRIETLVLNIDKMAGLA